MAAHICSFSFVFLILASFALLASTALASPSARLRLALLIDQGGELAYQENPAELAGGPGDTINYEAARLHAAAAPAFSFPTVYLENFHADKIEEICRPEAAQWHMVKFEKKALKALKSPANCQMTVATFCAYWQVRQANKVFPVLSALQQCAREKIRFSPLPAKVQEKLRKAKFEELRGGWWKFIGAPEASQIEMDWEKERINKKRGQGRERQ